MRKKRLSMEYIRSILDYNPETGILTWKYRPDMRSQWNGHYAGKPYGTANADGYIVGNINYVQFYAHRLAWVWMTGKWTKEVDHRDTNKANNKWDNLRKAKGNQNRWNKPKSRVNISGYKGVYYDKRRDKWIARIQANKQVFWLGQYNTPELAWMAYKNAAPKIHGKFARAA